jgi:cell division protein FtsB
MAFFDPKDWGLIANRMEKLKNLEKAEKQLSVQIAETKAELQELKTSAATIEKYARERYRMKKDNEEVFICK